MRKPIKIIIIIMAALAICTLFLIISVNLVWFLHVESIPKEAKIKQSIEYTNFTVKLYYNYDDNSYWLVKCNKDNAQKLIYRDGGFRGELNIEKINEKKVTVKYAFFKEYKDTYKNIKKDLTIDITKNESSRISIFRWILQLFY